MLIRYKSLVIYDHATYSFVAGSLFTDKAHDLAVFKVNTLSLPALPIGDSNNVFTGQWVCTIGNPQGYKGIFSIGVTSGIYGGNQYIADKVLQVSIPTWHGNSGGPVMNLSGEVIGVLSGGIGDREFMSYAVPSNFLVALINYANTVFDSELSTIR